MGARILGCLLLLLGGYLIGISGNEWGNVSVLGLFLAVSGGLIR